MEIIESFVGQFLPVFTFSTARSAGSAGSALHSWAVSNVLNVRDAVEQMLEIVL